MAIIFKCQACGQQVKATREMAGRRAACPKCGLPVVVPANGPVEDDPFEDFDEFMAAHAPVEPKNVPAEPRAPRVRTEYKSDPTWHLGLAAVMSFFVPGLGQIYKRQVSRGLAIQACVAALSIIGAGLITIAIISIPVVGLQSYPLLMLVIALVAIVAAAFVWQWQLFDAAFRKVTGAK